MCLAVKDADTMLALRNSKHCGVMFDALEQMSVPEDIAASEHNVDGCIRAAVDILESALVLAGHVDDRSIIPKRGALRKILKELASTLR
jgi:hypothetical protein